MAPIDADVPPKRKRALETLALLSRKWHPVVVVALSHHGALGFNDLQEVIPNVSGKVLSETLEALRDADLIERREVSESPLRVEYELTDEGRDMEPIFEALGAWGERHLERAMPMVVLADADRRLTAMYREWLADRYEVVRVHDGEDLAARVGDQVDVVVFDERVPDSTPREFVASVREHSRTVLLVGDRPDFDLLSVPCDDVLRKPIVRETALEAIDEQLSRRGESADRRELASLEARRSLFDSVYPVDRLEATEAYLELRTRLETLADRLEE